MATFVRGSTFEHVVAWEQQIWVNLQVEAGQTAFLFLRVPVWSMTPTRRFTWLEDTEEGWENVVDSGDLYAHWATNPGNSLIVPYRYVGPPATHDLSFQLSPPEFANIQFGHMLVVIQLEPGEEVIQWVVGGEGTVDENQLVPLPGNSEGTGQLWVAGFPLRQDMGIG